MTYRLTLLVFALGTLVESSALAAGRNNPEFLWQPAAREVGATVQYEQTSEYERKTIASFGPETITKESGSGIRGAFAIGITDNIAIGVGTTSIESKSVLGTIESKRTGIGDIEIGLASSWGGGFRLHAGVDAKVSPGKRVDPFGGANGNQYSGGLSYAPYVGLSIPIAGSSWVGILGTFETKQERKVQVSAAFESTVTGGNSATVRAFWEIPFRSVVLDLVGGVRTIDKEKFTAASGLVPENASYAATIAQVDLKYMFSPLTFIGARYLMTMYPEYLSTHPPTTVSAVNVSELSVLLRFAF